MLISVCEKKVFFADMKSHEEELRGAKRCHGDMKQLTNDKKLWFGTHSTAHGSGGAVAAPWGTPPPKKGQRAVLQRSQERAGVPEVRGWPRQKSR